VITKIASWFGLGWVKWALYAAVAATVFVGGYQLSALYYKRQLAEMEAETARVEAMREQEARELTEEMRRKEQETQAVVDELARRYVDEQSKLDSILKSNSALGRRLRDALAAANSRPAPEGPSTPGGFNDPALLRLLLAELSELAEQSAGAADGYAAQLRALQEYARAVSK
jgi:hypothetical protein